MGTSRSGRAPIYLQVADELEALILRSEYAAGDRLPTEQTLADEYGVNRHTAAQALNHLQSKGLIYRVKGRGSFVSPGRMDYWVAEQEGFSDSVANLGLRPSQKVLDVRRVGAYGRISREMIVPDGEPLVVFERVRYAGLVPLAYGTEHYQERLFPGLYERLHKGCRSVRALLRVHYGIEMYRTRSVFEIEPADPENARYLGVHLGSALLRVESLDALESGATAGWGVTYWRGEAMRVQVGPRDPVAQGD